MELRPRSHDKIALLLDKGVSIPNPLTIDVGDEVDVSLISGDGVALFPGCRLYGARTVVSAGAQLGAEAPVTIDDCQLGPDVALKGGYFRRSVFLNKVSLGSGAQIREGCLLEEKAVGAHCVGLKQTILFPFVTLGSLINFCDCLMAGGTGRDNHSEVGSSYVHFNFTPAGDKTTPSLFGDVARGVLLDQPPIFLGGQGGAVGPVRVGYGTVVAAGSILREDVTTEGRLVVAPTPPGFTRTFTPHRYTNLVRVVRNNLIYLANLVALDCWYREVRRPFFAQQELGEAVWAGALEVLIQARRERCTRLAAMAARVSGSTPQEQELQENMQELAALFTGEPSPAVRVDFLEALRQTDVDSENDYLDAIRSLGPEIRALGVGWLQGIVQDRCRQAEALLPHLGPILDHTQRED